MNIRTISRATLAAARRCVSARGEPLPVQVLILPLLQGESRGPAASAQGSADAVGRSRGSRVILVGDERLPDKLRREELVALGSRLRKTRSASRTRADMRASVNGRQRAAPSPRDPHRLLAVQEEFGSSSTGGARMHGDAAAGGSWSRWRMSVRTGG